MHYFECYPPPSEWLSWFVAYADEMDDHDERQRIIERGQQIWEDKQDEHAR